jgi:hypothetical protein
MSYKEDLYKNCLKVIEKLYKDSKYNSKIDLFRSFDIINSVNTNQMASKEHLTEALVPVLSNIKNLRHVAILGSWYGLLGIMLRQHISDEVYVDNVDTDSETKTIGQQLFRHDRTDFFVGDAVDHTIDRLKNYQLIINTSCEHMEQEDVKLITQAKHKNAVICFQSNNYVSIDSHINCSNSLDEFVEGLDLIDVMHASTLIIQPENYERYTVIGI